MTVNRETASTDGIVETRITLRTTLGNVEFSLWVPRYIHDALTEQDWAEAAARMQYEQDRIMGRMALSGELFCPEGRTLLAEAFGRAMGTLIYQRFVLRQQAAGNDQWSVPHTLEGERYKP